ncbi:hypothetical protein HMPREF1247_1597 [Atopobium sp. BV3Ac4]|nr:hypothetical protein HMPREF1247_1597 [Atopobium sp. BV3Ac4]
MRLHMSLLPSEKKLMAETAELTIAGTADVTTLKESSTCK